MPNTAASPKAIKAGQEFYDEVMAEMTETAEMLGLSDIYVKRLANIGVTARIIPGILPIVNYNRLPDFSKRDGITIPEKVKTIFEPIKDDPEKTLEAGKRYAIEQCQDLLKRGAPGIHLYALNKYQPVADILKEVTRD